jgi:multicomponent Na+:H+ antiporter subunit B
VSRRDRLRLFAVGIAGFGIVLLIAIAGLPDFGRDAGAYARLVDAVAPSERHVTEAVGAVTFDIRAIDSLGEEAILFAAVASVALALREASATGSGEDEDDQAAARAHEQGSGRPDTSVVIATIAVLALPIVVLVGLSVVGHGHLTPGGGFQGGVIIAAGLALFYVGADVNALQSASPDAVMEPMDGAGLGLYIGIGVVGLVGGLALFDNIFPPGIFGRLASGGMIPLLSLSVGLEVTAALIIATKHYLHQLVRLAERRRIS